MSARILSGDDPRAIEEAGLAIFSGEPVAFPTETVYGLGTNALDPEAVARIFGAKERPTFDPLIVHVASAGAILELITDEAASDARVADLAESFWPGPMTLVLRKRRIVPGIVTAGLDTVAVRIPDHPIALALIREAGVPVAAPSANRFGGLSPTTAAHVERELGDRIGLIVDGGPSRVGLESTVILLADGRQALLRPGGLPVEDIEAVIGTLEIPSERDARSLSPGRASSHYAPSVPVVLADPGTTPAARPGQRVGLLAASDQGRAQAEAVGGPFAAVEVLASDGDLVRSAARLFDALHALDQAGLDLIVAQPVAEQGLGRAVMDRLRRSATATMPG